MNKWKPRFTTNDPVVCVFMWKINGTHVNIIIDASNSIATDADNVPWYVTFKNRHEGSLYLYLKKKTRNGLCIAMSEWMTYE